MTEQIAFPKLASRLESKPVVDDATHSMFSGAIPQPAAGAEGVSFADLGLGRPILQVLDEIAFRHPTPVQIQVIPHALAGGDVVGLAQTGSGKTAAFILPMVEGVTPGQPFQGLVLCPTREIALQTTAFLEHVQQARGLRTACLIGGVRMGPQIDALARRPELVIATPGRLLDHVGRRNLSLDRVRILVLDEADHMLDLGFLPQIRDVLQTVPPSRQTMMFSATMPGPIEALTRSFLREPLRVDLRPGRRAAEGIEHRLYMVREEDRKRCLLALADQEDGAMLVFVRRKVDADWAARQLAVAGHPVDRIHGDRTQAQRVAALSGLRQGEHRILVATDVAARGIDIPIIEHIVNAYVPEEVEDYIHRAGRTARGSAGGTVSTIATWRDRQLIRAVEEALGQELPRTTLPGVATEVETTSRGPLRRRRPLRRRL